MTANYNVIQTAVMYLRGLSRDELAQFEPMIRFKLNLPDHNEVAYAVSRELFEQHGFGEYERRWLAQRIADEMISYVNKR